MDSATAVWVRFENENAKTSIAEKKPTGKNLKRGIFSVRWGLRYYSAEFGRWVNRDPIGERGGIGILSFVHNNALYWIDAVGLSFETANEAAAAALAAIANYSFDNSTELCGRVYLKKATCEFHYTKPTLGTPGSCDPGDVPDGTLSAGFYHTHPSGTSGASGGDKSQETSGGRIWILPKPISGTTATLFVHQRLPLMPGSTVLQWQKKKPSGVSWKADDPEPDFYSSFTDRKNDGLGGAGAKPSESIYVNDGSSDHGNIRPDVRCLEACEGKTNW